MSLPTSIQRTQMQAAGALMLTDTCTIMRDVMVIEADGSRYQGGEQAVASDVPCMATLTATARDGTVAARLASVGAWLFRLPLVTEVKAGDRVLWSARKFTVTGDPESGGTGAVVLLVSANETR